MLVPLLRRHLAPYRTWILIVFGFQLVQTIANLYLPTLNADIIDDGVIPGDTARIWELGGFMLAATVVQIVCTIVAVYFGAKVSMSLGRDLRASVFDSVESFAARELGQFGAPTLITRGTIDVQQVQLLVFMILTLLVTSPIMGVGGVIMALRQDVEMSGLLIVVIPILVVSLTLIIRQMKPLFRVMQVQLDGLNGVMREQIMGIRVIRAFAREEQEERRFGAANDATMEVAIASGRIMALFFPLIMLIMNVSVALALWLGAVRIGDGALDIGTLTAFQNYLVQILMAVMMSTMLLMLWPRAEVAAERITEVLDTPPSVRAPEQPVAVPATGTVDVVGASYAYPGAEQDVLHDVDLIARPGETTAIVGSTGAGKTTLLSLVPRLFDVTGGSVSLGGVDVRDATPADVWAQIGLVPQKAFLFSGTIGSNLRYGDPHATDAELWDALEVAQAREFVEKAGGLEAQVAQGGQNLSGGQRQRLAIARAIVKRPNIYLFDDAFSALDYATDAALRSALAPLTRDASVIIVAQRVSTIRHADRIVVLDEGRVVGTGTHADLFETNDVYREIVLSQLTEAEATA